MVKWQKIRTLEIERQVVNYYNQGLPAAKINECLGYPFKTTKSIFDILKKYGITRRSSSDYRSVNDNVFKFIDSELKAYWIGMLLTDGWVQKHKGQAEIGIQLQAGDKEHLESLRQLLGTTNNIIETKKTLLDGSIHKCYRLTVKSDIMAADLARYGIVPNKSSKMKIYPSLIPKSLFRHFIRGIFDGNGSAHVDKNKQLRIKFYGTYDVVQFINHYLWQELDVTYRNELSISSSLYQPVYQLEYSKWDDVNKIAAYLYDGATVFLGRKREVICNFLAQR